MDVTKKNFETILPVFEQKLKECNFFAIDAEMTGLHLSSNRKDEIFDSAEERYQRLKESAQNFLIMQFGVSFFKWKDLDASYEASTFNFYVFPQPFGRWDLRFTSQSSSIDFLRSHNFDFNKFIYEGIPFLPLDQMEKEEKRLEANDIQRDPLVLTKPADVAFVSDELDKVRQWLAATQPPPDEASRDGAGDPPAGADLAEPPASLALSPANAYLRLALRQSLEQQFQPPGFYVEKVENESGLPSLRLTRSSPERAREVAEGKRWERERSFREACGFGRAVRLLVQSGKAMVGHNMAFDLAYFMHQFVGDMPASFPAFQEKVKSLFPGGLYDTKYISKQFPAVFVLSGTHLETVYRMMTPGASPAKDEGEKASEASTFDLSEVLASETPPSSVELPRVIHADGFERYKPLFGTNDSMAHEAGYDAFMTGAAFAGLLQLAEARERGNDTVGSCTASPQDFSPNWRCVSAHKNKVHVMFSDLEFLPLEGEPPCPDRSNVFLLSDFPAETKTGQILALFGGLGLGDVRVVWLDQNSAFVTVLDKALVVDVVGKVSSSGWRGKCSVFGETKRKDEVLEGKEEGRNGVKRLREVQTSGD